VLSGSLRDPAPTVRIAALQALGAMGRDARAALTEVHEVENDPSEDVRQIARQAVRQITGKD
jgi:hypothetical protein